MIDVAGNESYFSELRDLMELNESVKTLEQLCCNAQNQLNNIITNKKESKYLNNTDKVNQIREVIRCKNKSERLFNLTKFE
jgi:hypothetical protein